MIIQWSHHSVAHGARGMILNHLRQRDTWIVNVDAIVLHLINSVLHAANYKEKYDTKIWQIYHRKDAKKDC